MKRLACLLLVLSTLTAQLVKAQSCPATATYTNPNQSGPFDLTAGKTILLNDGKSYQITIQNDFSSTSSICVLNGSTLSLTFQNVNSMGKGGFINVDKNATLTINSSINNFPLTINNSGTTTQLSSITYADGATITNSGTYSIPTSVTLNSGTVTFTNSGTLNISGSLAYNNGTFAMTNATNSNINISGNLLLSNTTIKNSGNLTVSGDVTLQSASVITNNSYMTLSGALAFSGATFTNNGVIYTSGSTTINAGSSFNNNCTIKSSGSFSTNGIVSNNGNIILASSFTNQGTFTNGTNGWVQGTGDFNNNGTITGSGNFYFVGTTTNQGPFNGTSSSSPINFYDATLNNGKNHYFDNQITNPTNTTRNTISPNNAISFTSCADVSAPVITAQPSTQMLCSSSITEAKFSVTATNSTTPTYQWYKNGTAVSGATSSSYSATGLTFADTANIYYVGVTNTAGTTYSNKVYAKYVILTQPSNLDIVVGSTATFTVTTAWATGYQWQKNSANIGAATSSTYSKTNVALADAASYTAIVNYSGGTCTSNAAMLTVENLPAITTQPVSQTFCTAATTTATFSVASATSASTLSYQWYKNGAAISGATTSTLSLTGLTLADNASTYYVVLKNNVGSTQSNTVAINYVIIAQPTPTSQYLATGSSATFTVKGSGIVTGYQWQLAGKNIGGATAAVYTDPSVALNEAGNYTATLNYNGGTCTTNAAVLTVENLPTITTQPLSQVLCSSANTTATFSVSNATSTSALSYQWYKNGTTISGATTNTLSLSGLTLADSANTYYVVLKNGIGIAKSNTVAVNYIIYSQPSNVFAYPGAPVSFTVGASNIKNYQWLLSGKNIGGPAATLPTYTKYPVAVIDSGSYQVVVTYNATSSYQSGTCTSNPATLSIIGLPTITSQPINQVVCNSTTTSAAFSVIANSVAPAGGISNIALSYQWYKKGQAIANATSATYTATGLTLADTANAFTVVVSNVYGAITSNNVYVKYVILSQPSSLLLATGNSASFSTTTSGATSIQWVKNTTDVSGAMTSTYALPVVNYADSGNYTARVSYNGGTCTSNTAILKTSIVLYSTTNGNLNDPKAWGVNTDGSGSTPINFTRDEHTFVVSNRAKAAVTISGDLTIAGTLDVASSNVTLADNSTLTVGRIIRSLPGGMLGASEKDSIIIKGLASTSSLDSSDLYFDPKNNTAQRLIISGSNVALHTALNITNNNGNQAGSNGVVQITGGNLYTNDSLILKSNNLGTGSIASSTGTIVGKVTIEKYVTNRRSWRLMGAPVSTVNAPTIHASYQENSVSSTDNPHSGYGTHITYGAIADGFDQNPQKSYSMRVYNSAGSLVGVPATNKTLVTDYPAFMLFIRGDRSYPILTTTNNTKPTSTVLRVTGNLNQGTISAKAISAKGSTLISNPYACPINFTKIVSTSSNVLPRITVWDPSLAGTKGTGAWVILDGTTGTYKATPPSSLTTLIQAGEGFFVQSKDGVNTGSMVINESMKDLSSITTTNDRIGNVTTDTSLEVNLKLFNPDSTTAIADGILVNFNASYNDSIDNYDAVKMNNGGENLSIKESNSNLTIDDRTMPKTGDSLQLNLTNAQSASYQFEIVPTSLGNAKFSLYDKYLNTISPISSTDTTRINFIVNNSIAASQAANRFVIVMQKTKISNTVLPVLFTSVKAYAQEKAINVEWKVSNETGIMYYEVQKSTDGTSFSAVGNVVANGSSSYLFTDASPATGVNYYRIKSVSKTGETHYTSVVNAQIQAAPTSGTSLVSVYPNPFTGTQFTLTLSNLAAGTYTLSVVDGTGKVVFSQLVAHSGGTASQKISLSNKLVPGVYQVIISSASSKNITKVIAL